MSDIPTSRGNPRNSWQEINQQQIDYFIDNNSEASIRQTKEFNYMNKKSERATGRIESKGVKNNLIAAFYRDTPELAPTTISRIAELRPPFTGPTGKITSLSKIIEETPSDLKSDFRIRDLSPILEETSEDLKSSELDPQKFITQQIEREVVVDDLSTDDPSRSDPPVVGPRASIVQRDPKTQIRTSDDAILEARIDSVNKQELEKSLEQGATGESVELPVAEVDTTSGEIVTLEDSTDSDIKNLSITSIPKVETPIDAPIFVPVSRDESIGSDILVVNPERRELFPNNFRFNPESGLIESIAPDLQIGGNGGGNAGGNGGGNVDNVVGNVDNVSDVNKTSELGTIPQAPGVSEIAGQITGGKEGVSVHGRALSLFFGKKPYNWDNNLFDGRDEYTQGLSQAEQISQALAENKRIVEKYGVDIFVSRVVYSSGPMVLNENKELVQLWASLKRGFVSGDRVPTAEIVLGQLVPQGQGQTNKQMGTGTMQISAGDGSKASRALPQGSTLLNQQTSSQSGISPLPQRGGSVARIQIPSIRDALKQSKYLPNNNGLRNSFQTDSLRRIVKYEEIVQPFKLTERVKAPSLLTIQEEDYDCFNI